jgi:hypothetical protein
MSLSDLISAWHAADRGLWATTADGFERALAAFCTGTDNVVRICDQAGRVDLAERVADYKEELLATRNALVRQHYPTIQDALRELNTRTMLARGKCLNAIARLVTASEAKPRKGKAEGKQPARKCTTAAVANQILLAAIAKDPDRAAWSSRDWARHVGKANKATCSTSTIAKTDTYRECVIAREKAKAERAPRNRGRRKPRHRIQA